MKEKIKLILMIILFVGIIIGINFYINYKSKEKVLTIKEASEKTMIDFVNDNSSNDDNKYYEMAKVNVSKNEINNIISNEIENKITNEVMIDSINEIIHVNENTFADEVYEEEKIVIADFYADWCTPCKMLSPILEDIARKRNDIKIVKINVDENYKLANEYKAYSIPLLVIFKDGNEVNRVVGLRSEEDILNLVEKEVN